MILAGQSILKAIKAKSLIDPFDADSLGPGSYELRVGSYLDGAGALQRLDQKQPVVLRPQSSVLLGTQEKVNMPLDLCGIMYLKSTYGRFGLVPWSQGFVDPGYTGFLTLSIHNLTDQFLEISGGQKFCHLVFCKMDEAAEEGYQGPYKDSIGATDAKGPKLLTTIGRGIGRFGQAIVEGVGSGIGSGIVK